MKKNASTFVFCAILTIFVILTSIYMATYCEHDWEKQSTTATCTESGVIVYKCSICEKTREEKEVSPGHSLKESIKASTCSEAGEKTTYCEVCEYKSVESLGLLNHTFVGTKCKNCDYAVTTTWSTDTDCTKCGKVNIIGDNKSYYKKLESSATCTEDGAATYRCPKCSRVFYVFEKASDHNWNCYSIEATCQKDGFAYFACKICYERKTEHREASKEYCNFLYEGMVTKNGHKYMEYKCTRCREKKYEKVW